MTARKNNLHYDVLLGASLSLILIIGAWQKWLPLSLIEVFGFVTGGICVWLTVKENIWTWPLGIANAVFFIFLFADSRLYADMALQFVYVALGFLGWYWWLRGGDKRDELPVARADMRTIGFVLLAVMLATWGGTLFLQRTNAAAPFPDALTTALSLGAQYLLTRKFIQNWYLWIAADLIYIPLYFSKGLYLTAILYGVFLGMCLIGLKRWRTTLAAQAGAGKKN